MKALTITPNCYCTENEVEPITKTDKKLCKTDEFVWQCYLKQERKHNIALSMFTK